MWILDSGNINDMKNKTLIILLLSTVATATLITLFIKLKPSGQKNHFKEQIEILPVTSGIESESSDVKVIWSADLQNQEVGIFDYKDIKK